MALFDIRLEEIDATQLSSFIEEASEGKLLDFKEELNLNTEADKKEFLADITSFANTSGGDLIIGVKDLKPGYEVCGLPNTLDIDSFKQQINNILRHSIEPRLYPPEMKEVVIGEHTVLIIRVQRSWNGPHPVTKKSKEDKKTWSCFYNRNSSGKFSLDIGEIRSAFIASETTGERIRNFRAERIGKILSSETPIPLNDAPKVVLHAIPINALTSNKLVNLEIMSQLKKKIHPWPLGCKHSDWPKFNFDGYLTQNRTQNRTGA